MTVALIIEKDARAANWVEGVLRLEGVECVSCASPEAILQQLAKPAHPYAFVLLTVEASDPKELQLLTVVRNAWPATPIVLMINGPFSFSLASRAADLGAQDCWEKPLIKDRVRGTVREILATQDPLQSKIDELRNLILGGNGERLMGESRTFLSMLREVAKVVTNPEAPVLITGETGVGKELIARAIHLDGPRGSHPLVPVNVAAIPSDLVESHLFGHEKGAFTSAFEHHTGHIEEAGAGTLFLDEVGELAPIVQVKLLRVLQVREFRRLGGKKPLPFEARLICATNVNLEQNVVRGTFREDLYHRITTYSIHIPALRERDKDIDILRQHFLEQYAGERHLQFAPETLSILRSYPFYGNVRELQRMVAGAVIQCEGDTILPRHLPLIRMGTLARLDDDKSPHLNDYTRPQPDAPSAKAGKPSVEDEEGFAAKLNAALPRNWETLTYWDVQPILESTFDRVFLWHKYERAGFKIGRAAVDCGMSVKTFRAHWEKCGLPSLKGDGEASDD